MRLCDFLVIGLDIMDESGTVVTEYEHDVYKVRLDAQGRQIHIEKTKGTAPKYMLSSLVLDLSIIARIGTQ